MSNAPRNVDYRKTQPQNYTDAIGGEHIAIYKGKCVVCGRNVYNAKDYHYVRDNYGNPIDAQTTLGNEYNPDPRGTIDYWHACQTLEAWEYGKVGADVRICAACDDVQELQRKGLAIAYAQWTDIPELETEAQ